MGVAPQPNSSNGPAIGLWAAIVGLLNLRIALATAPPPASGSASSGERYVDPGLILITSQAEHAAGAASRNHQRRVLCWLVVIIRRMVPIHSAGLNHQAIDLVGRFTHRKRAQGFDAMEMTRLAIPDVVRLVPRRFGDNRGHFSETWNVNTLRKLGIDPTLAQENQSYSANPGTVRGLHYQAPPHAQTKLIRVVRGAVLDVSVDVRRNSSSYGKWVAEELSADNGAQILVPKGFLHGFVTKEPDTIVIYKADSFYAPESEGSVRFDDPILAIDWGIASCDATLSGKDGQAPGFADFMSPFA